MINRSAYKQLVTYWGGPVPDGYGGYTFDLPSEFYARWEDRAEEYMTQAGETLVSKSVVYVPQEVEIGGYLYLGRSAEVSPTSVTGAMRIQQVRKVPDLRAAYYEIRAFL